MVDPGEIKETIQNVFFDIKAEAVIADLIENGINIDDLVSSRKGIFKRRYTRDIDSIGELRLNNGQSLIDICLNRDGFYDALPEGLFHERSRKSSDNKEASSNESKKLKQEEKATRNFFLPFENEIVRQGVMLELEERKILGQFSERLFDDIYPNIWDLDLHLDRKYIYRLALMLHFAHKIAGKVKLMAKCLEVIIEESVEIEIVNSSGLNDTYALQNSSPGEKCSLGNGELGVDFVCGNYEDKFGKTLLFKIGPLKNTKVSDYLVDGPLSKFLKCFYGYFVPVDYDVSLNIQVDRKEQYFKLNEEAAGPVLGFESAI